MTTIAYYDLSYKVSSLGLPNGTLVQVDEIVEMSLSKRTTPDSFATVSLKVRENDVDPLGVKSPKKWEDYMALLIWSISGREPLRYEILRGRQILMALPPAIKKQREFPRFVFGVLSYILVGFKSHMENGFQPDSNRICDIVEFISKLSMTKDHVFESFLCAHRGKGGVEKFYLVDDVEPTQALIALNLSKALLANNPWSKKRSLEWFQQGATEFACLNMFPEMFLRYLLSSEIPELLGKLDRHLCQVKTMMMKEECDVASRMSESDQKSSVALTFMSARYGQSWRSTDFSRVEFANDPIVGIALTDTLPLMMRQMPFYTNQHVYSEHLKRKEVYVANNLEKAKSIQSQFSLDLVRLAIERFYEIQNMHPTAKALYETTFYYLWGRHAEEDEVFSIGLDRDHSKFQNRAWALGMSEARGIPFLDDEASSLLYARRSVKAKVSPMLKDFSVRQFWR